MRARRSTPRRVLLAAAAALALLPSAGPADTPDLVTLAKGAPLKGRVVYEDKDILLLRVGTKEKQIAQAEITAVESITRSLHTLLDRLGGLDSGMTGQAQIDGLLELADFAKANDLPGESRLLYLRVLLVDSENPAANAALGHREKDGRFIIQHNKKPFATKELASVGRDWGERWTLETTHYKVQSSLDVGSAIEAAFDLEHEYRAFFGLFQEHLRLLDIVEEKMLVELHGDKGSYPEPDGNRRGYYDAGSLSLIIDGSSGVNRATLAHEGVHQLIYVTTKRTRGAKGQIPAWLDEGLGDYFGAALNGQPGHASFTFGTPASDHLRTMKNADKLLDLNRILTFVATDFQVSTDANLKYAESWALLQFGLHGADGAYRAATMEFIKRAYEGKSSMSDFKKCLEPVDIDDFEKAFFAWAAKGA
jgi:hypothetical protein